MAGFGTGERFKSAAAKTPGPGAYDPKNDIGYKVDPTSGFLGNDRFVEDKSGGGTHRSSEVSPGRERKQGKDGRSYAWTAQRLLELEKEVEMLKKSNKEKDKLIHQQEAELKAKRAAEDSLRQAQRQLENGEGKWSAEVEQLKSQLLIANEKRGKLDKEVMDLEGRFREKDQEVQVLGNEMIKFQEAMSNQTDRMRSVNAEIDSLQQQLKASQEQISQQKNEITRLTDENQALSSELVDKSSQLETSLADAENRFEMQKTSHAEDINSLKMQVDAARQEVSLRAGMIEDLEKKVDKFKGRLDTAREEQCKLEEANKKLEKENKGQQDDLSSVQNKLLKVEAELSDKSKGLEVKEQEVEKLQKLVETAEEASLAATGKAMDMEMELTAKFNEIAALREECAGLKESVKDKDGIIADLDTQNKTAAAKAEETNAILKELEARVMKAEKDLAEKDRSCSELQATLATRESEVSELRGLQAGADKTVKKISEECETQRAHISQLQEHLKCAKDELDSKLSGFESQTVTLNLKISEAENKISELQKELQVKVAALSTAESHLSEAQKEIADKAAVLSKMEVCHTELSESAEKTEKELVDKLNNIEKQHELQIATLKAEAGAVSALRTDVGTMETELRDARIREEGLQADLASALGQLEDVTSLKNQVSELQAELEQALKRATKAETAAHRYKAELRRGEAVKAEMSRLMEENDVLVRRTQELDADVKGLLSSNTSTLGHHNSKQKIQYHLKLKQDLEELKRECTALLREKFHLEQCIRYLSSVGALEIIPQTYAEPARKSQIVIPKSLAGNVNTLTPSSRNQLKWAGRGKAAKTEDLSPYHAREDMEQAIEQVKRETAEEVEGFIQSGKESTMDFADGGAAGNEGDTEALSTSERSSPAGSQDSPRASPMLDGIDSKIQARILARINLIVSRRPKRKADTQQENHAERDIF